MKNWRADEGWRKMGRWMREEEMERRETEKRWRERREKREENKENKRQGGKSAANNKQP